MLTKCLGRTISRNKLSNSVEREFASAQVYLGRLFVVCLVAALIPSTVFGAIRLLNVKVIQKDKIEITFDQRVPIDRTTVDYLPEIVQFSFRDTTIFPAKIMSVNTPWVSKVFSYQYAPDLVRLRLSTKGNAKNYKEGLKTTWKGSVLTLEWKGTGGIAGGAVLNKAVSSLESSNNSGIPTSVPALIGASRTSGPKNSEQNKDDDRKLSEQEKTHLLEKLGEATSANKGEESTMGSGIAGSIAGSSSKIRDAVSTVKSSARDKEDTEKNSNERNEIQVRSNLPKLASPPIGKSLAIVVMFLVVVGTVAFVLAKASGANKSGKLNRFLKGITGQGSDAMIEIISRQSLGPKKSIVVAKVKDRTLVLGMSDSGISLITEFDDDLEEYKDTGGVERASSDLDKTLYKTSSQKSPKKSYKVSSPLIADPVIQRQVPESAFEDVLRATDTKSAKSQILSRLEGMKRL